MRNPHALLAATSLLTFSLTGHAQPVPPQQAIYYEEARRLEAEAARAEAARGVSGAAMQGAANVNGAAASALKSAVPVLSAAPQVLGVLNHMFGSASGGAAAAPGQLGGLPGPGQNSAPATVTKPVFNNLADLINSSGAPTPMSTGSTGLANAGQPGAPGSSGGSGNPGGSGNSGDSLGSLLDSGEVPAPTPTGGTVPPTDSQSPGMDTSPSPSATGNPAGGWNAIPPPNLPASPGDPLDSALNPPPATPAPTPSPVAAPTEPGDGLADPAAESPAGAQSLYEQAKSSFNDFLDNAKQKAGDALNNMIPPEAKNAAPFLEHVGHGVGINSGAVQQKDYGDGLDEDNKMLNNSGGTNP